MCCLFESTVGKFIFVFVSAYTLFFCYFLKGFSDGFLVSYQYSTNTYFVPFMVVTRKPPVWSVKIFPGVPVTSMHVKSRLVISPVFLIDVSYRYV